MQTRPPGSLPAGKKGVKLHNSRRMSVYARSVRFVAKGSKRKIKLQDCIYRYNYQQDNKKEGEQRMKRKLQENKKKGFTLVELIVVLVILAILAALLIPALTGYIDKARKKQVIAETRSCVMAAQTLGDELYGQGKKDADLNNTTNLSMADIQTLAETENAPTSVKFSNGKVSELVYTNGMTCTYKETWGAGENPSDGKYDIN